MFQFYIQQSKIKNIRNDQNQLSYINSQMHQVQHCFQELRSSIKLGVKDNSLATELKNCIKQLILQGDSIQKYTKIMFELYDLSNSYIFIKNIQNPQLRNQDDHIEMDQMALSIKSCVLIMLAKLIVMFNDNPQLQIPVDLMKESLQIMVLISRIFLDFGNNFLNEVKNTYYLCATFYDFSPQLISIDLQILHHLNILELMKYNVDTGSLDISELKKIFDVLTQKIKASNSFANYLEYSQYIALQITLKLFKKGNIENAKLLKVYLPEKELQMINSLTEFDAKSLIDDKSTISVSPFYELYLQIKQNGIQNIAQEHLRAFIEKQDHFNDPRLFDVVALTGQTLPLLIWFEINLNYKKKNENISLAYRCFMFLVDSQFVSKQKKQKRNQEITLVQLFKKNLSKIEKYYELSRIIMVSLLSEKKQQGQPILNLMKKMIKILIYMIMNLYPKTDSIKQFMEKLTLLCNKHSLIDVIKSISCISFYYELIMGVANEESFNKFCKANLMDKSSDLFKILKLAYEMQRDNFKLTAEDDKMLIKRQAYIMVLFQKKIEKSLVLQIQPNQYAKMPQKFEIYFILLASYLKEKENNKSKFLLEVINHFEETLLIVNFSSFNTFDLKYLNRIRGIMLQLSHQQNITTDSLMMIKISIISLYLISFQIFEQQIDTFNLGILLNRYAKVTKLINLLIQYIDTNHLDLTCEYLISDFIYASKILLTSSLEKMKIKVKQNQKICEIGQTLLYDTLLKFIQKFEKNSHILQYFKFVKFEIMSICDNINENDINQEKNIKLLKIYCSSIYIKKNIKLKILRKLIKEQVATDNKQITLSDFNELITLTEDPKEKKIYAQHMIRIFGQEGKTYLLLQANKNKDFEFLQETDNDEEDYY